MRSLLEIRQAGVVIQQWDTSCGAAALATVFTYAFRDPVSEKSVAQAMLRRSDPLRVKVRGGFSLLDMKRYAEERGYVADGFRQLTVQELLAMSNPIVPIQEFGNAHFVVVRGAAANAGELDIADPGFGNRRMSVEQFRKVWRDGIAFVIARPRP